MSSLIDTTKPTTGTATVASVRANFSIAKTEIESLQTTKQDVFTPVSLSGNTSLTIVSHANREIITNSATALTLTLPATASEGIRFYGVNIGVGLLSFVNSGGGAVLINSALPLTVDQYSAFEIRYLNGAFVRVA